MLLPVLALALLPQRPAPPPAPQDPFLKVYVVDQDGDLLTAGRTVDLTLNRGGQRVFGRQLIVDPETGFASCEEPDLPAGANYRANLSLRSLPYRVASKEVTLISGEANTVVLEVKIPGEADTIWVEQKSLRGYAPAEWDNLRLYGPGGEEWHVPVLHGGSNKRRTYAAIGLPALESFTLVLDDPRYERETRTCLLGERVELWPRERTHLHLVGDASHPLDLATLKIEGLPNLHPSMLRQPAPNELIIPVPPQQARALRVRLPHDERWVIPVPSLASGTQRRVQLSTWAARQPRVRLTLEDPHPRPGVDPQPLQLWLVHQSGRPESIQANTRKKRAAAWRQASRKNLLTGQSLRLAPGEQAELRLPRLGRWSVYASVGPYTELQQSFVVRPNGTRDFTLRLPERGSLRVDLGLHPDWKPSALRLELQRDGHEPMPMTVSSKGVAAITNAPVGTYELVVKGLQSGHVFQRRAVELAPNRLNRLELDLTHVLTNGLVIPTKKPKRIAGSWVCLDQISLTRLLASHDLDAEAARDPHIAVLDQDGLATFATEVQGEFRPFVVHVGQRWIWRPLNRVHIQAQRMTSTEPLVLQARAIEVRDKEGVVVPNAEVVWSVAGIELENSRGTTTRNGRLSTQLPGGAFQFRVDAIQLDREYSVRKRRLILHP